MGLESSKEYYGKKLIVIFAISIVAITGLAGHAYGSWKARNGNYMWLQHSLPRDLAKLGSVRIMTYGYNTTLTEVTRRVDSLDDLADEFLDYLLNARSKVRHQCWH